MTTPVFNPLTQPMPIPRWAWFLSLVPLLIWLTFRSAIENPELFYAINRFTREWPDGMWGLFVYLGNGWGVFSLTMPLLLFAPRMMTACIIGGSLAGLVSRFFKFWLAMPRPAAVLDNSTFHIIGEAIHHYALPSGHALTVFAVATGIYFSLPAHQRLAGLWLFVVAILGGIARIAVGAHWPADVLAGTTLGMLGGLVGIALANRLPASWFSLQSWWLRFVAVAGGSVALYVLVTERLDLDMNRPLQTLGIIVVLATAAHFLQKSFGTAAR